MASTGRKTATNVAQEEASGPGELRRCDDNGEKGVLRRYKRVAYEREATTPGSLRLMSVVTSRDGLILFYSHGRKFN